LLQGGIKVSKLSFAKWSLMVIGPATASGAAIILFEVKWWGMGGELNFEGLKR